MSKSILFISQSYPESRIGEYSRYTKVGLDYAANNLSRAIIRGFEDNQINVNIINYPLLGSFPIYYKSPIVKGYNSSDNNYDSISYLNIIYLKRRFIRNKVYSKIEKWCSQTSGEKIIFFYSYTFLPIITKLKKKYKDLKTCVLIADLPEFMSTDNGIITRIHHLMGGNKPITGECFQLVDGYVLLTSAMKDRMPMHNKPWIVIEGIYNPEKDKVSVDKEVNKTLLYTGDLGRRYGIVDLLEAFHGIPDENYRLWICGSGDGLEDIKRYMREDNRIIYWGCLPRKEIIAMQKKATLLVNPRKSNEEYTKYSFPSKTMEYMASGTPTLMSRLQCIPKDYDEHLFFFENETVEGLRSRIVEICNKSKDELKLIGDNASRFILNNKMPKPQVSKIAHFLYSL